MSKIEYINATDARKQLFDLIEEAQKSPLPIHLTVRGVPKAVIVSQDEYESWVATLETLSDPELMKGIEEGNRDIDSSNVVSLDDLKQELKH